MSHQRARTPHTEGAPPSARTPLVGVAAPWTSAEAPPVTLPAPELTIVIPTRNESENVSRLVQRLGRALPGVAMEAIFVDDSDDRTPEAIAAVAAQSAGRVRLLHRAAGNRPGGLGGAVLAGIRRARGRWVVVMDGDLQHPPEAVPAIVAAARGGSADVVVASRYRRQGRVSGLDGPLRRLVSSVATVATRLAFPHRLRRVTDPMSGFFALRRAVLDGVDLRPRGYKILLEILVRARIVRVVEVSYAFQPRQAGTSKASLREGLRFLGQLARLRLGTLVRPRSGTARLAGFAAAGASGIAVNSAALWLLGGPLGVPYLVAAFLAVQLAIGWNFAVIDRLVMPGTDRSVLRRLGRFWLLNNSSVPVHLALLYTLVRGLHMHYLTANLVAVGAVFAGRYLLTRRWVYGAKDPVLPVAVRRAATGLRRAPQTRVVLAFLLTLAAVPTTAAVAWNGLWTRGATVPLVIPLGAATALLVARLRPPAGEPDVHDRQVDGLIAAILLFAAAAMTAMEPGVRRASSGWLLLATVAYLAAATTLLLGTRAAARLRWVLVLPLVSADGVLPPSLASEAARVVRVGVALVTGPLDGRLDPGSLTFWYHGQPLALPASAVPGTALAGALICLSLAALSCFGLTVRLLVRLAAAAAVLTGVAVASVAAAMLVGQVFGAQPVRVALMPAFADLALAVAGAAVVWRWSRHLPVPRARSRHYLPRGRVAAVALCLAAVALALRVGPELSVVRPHVPFVAMVAADGSIQLVPVGERR